MKKITVKVEDLKTHQNNYTITLLNIDTNWEQSESPTKFRKLNELRIGELSNLFVALGLQIVKLDHPDINEDFYLGFIHPVVNDNILKGMRSKKRKTPLHGVRR